MSIFTRHGTRALVIRDAAGPLRSSTWTSCSSRLISRHGRNQINGGSTSGPNSSLASSSQPVTMTSLYVHQFHTSSPFKTDNRIRNKTDDADPVAVPVQRLASSILAISPTASSSTMSSPTGSSGNSSTTTKREPSPILPVQEVHSTSSKNPTTQTLSASSVNLPPRPKKRVSKFFIFKFFEFVQGYNKVLEKKFPGAMNVYRVFMVGVKDFARELTDYVRISGKVLMSSTGIRNLTSVELEIYYRLPMEVTRVAPTLIISALPFMNYIMFPIAYYFPKRLLSSHFWSIQQKSQFAIDNQKTRLYYYRPVFRSLQANVELVRDPGAKEKCRTVLDKLGSGSHPSSREIMDIKRLFESDPFSLKAIYGPHVKGLCRMHGIHTIYLSRGRLFDRAEMLHVMDAAMIRDGIFNLKTEDLKTACFIRGLNASNTSHEDMMEYLQQWSSISTSISPHSYSLLLHLPILLAYNNPNNWALLV